MEDKMFPIPPNGDRRRNWGCTTLVLFFLQKGKMPTGNKTDMYTFWTELCHWKPVIQFRQNLPSKQNQRCRASTAYAGAVAHLSYHSLFFNEQILTKNNQIWRKVGPDFCNSKFISATGQSSPAAFTVPSCNNYTCDSGCVTLYRFIQLWMMNIDRNDTYLPKIETGLWDVKFTSLPYNRRHSPCRHASRELYMRLGTCISYSINTFWRMKHEQDTGLPTNGTAQQTPLMY